MSRGFRASEQTTAVRIGGMATPAQIEKAGVAVASNAEHRSAFKQLFEALSAHIKNDVLPDAVIRGGSIKAAGKQTKLMFVEALKKLPPEIRKVMEVDREKAKFLFRGVKDRDITEGKGWENGKFVYGFTPDKTVARDFALSDRSGFTGILTPEKDIESFGGILDPQKVHEVYYAVRPLLPLDMRREMDESIFDQNEHYGVENELLVYDIKFRKEGDKFYKS